MQHAWYLAADFQLTIMGTLIQMFIWRFTKLTKVVYSITMVISFVVPAVITYIYRFDGTFMAAPEWVLKTDNYFQAEQIPVTNIASLWLQLTLFSMNIVSRSMADFELLKKGHPFWRPRSVMGPKKLCSRAHWVLSPPLEPIILIFLFKVSIVNHSEIFAYFFPQSNNAGRPDTHIYSIICILRFTYRGIQIQEASYSAW